MAIHKALITNKSEFIRPGVQAAKINPFIYSNQEDIPGEATVVGAAPSYADGVRGKALSHAGATAFCWRNKKQRILMKIKEKSYYLYGKTFTKIKSKKHMINI